MARWNWLAIVLTTAAAACGGGNGGTAGTSTSSGTTGGGGQLAPGLPCGADGECGSGICGPGGSGFCCSAACSTSEPICGRTACDNTGACVNAPAGTSCDSCASGVLTPGGCDGLGSCQAGIANPCPGGLACNAAGNACIASCGSTADCAAGFFCQAGACVAKTTIGACGANEECASGVCGIGGSGNCCASTCTNVASPCGATDCDARTGACVFPDSTTACGTGQQSCSGSTQTNATFCDGQGNCPTQTTTDCSPFVCGATACLKNCTDASSCGAGDFCDVFAGVCCAPLSDGATLKVDSVNGDDTLGCCGIGANPPCQTLTQAMKLVDLTQAKNVTLRATVSDGGGTWSPPKEHYPVILGWGVELNAPGVYFYAPNATGIVATFDVDAYSPNDTVGYASVVGTAARQVGVGMNQGDNAQSTAYSGIQIEADQTLYIANAVVNGNASAETDAITLAPGGGLVLGQDQSGLITGTVNIGNGNNLQATDGFDGIFCRTDNHRGCTITDAPLLGKNSVVIQGQESADIVARDYANISLSSSPIFGVPPGTTGFGECSWKPDGASLRYPAAISLSGPMSLSLSNAAIHCISADGIAMSPTARGSPTVSIANTTITNVETALLVSAGTATVSNSTFQFNYNGVVQGTQGHVDLSGADAGGTNTVICSANQESIFGTLGLAGVNVLNQSASTLNASNVVWDTPAPDLFTCKQQLQSCACAIASCTNTAGSNGMDAVAESTGAILTAGNSQSGLAAQRGCK